MTLNNLLRRGCIFFLFVILCLPYLSLFFNGTFLVDDWGQINHLNSIWDRVSEWKTLWSYRPVTWISLPIVTKILGDSFQLYFLLNILLLWLSVRNVVYSTILGLTNLQRLFFILAFLSPAICSTLVLSPVNQFYASLSIYLASLAYIREKIELGIFSWTFLLFLISLFTYEISFPLILIFYFLQLHQLNRTTLVSILRPIILLVFFLISWQKIISLLLLGSNFSRLSGFDVKSLLSYFISIIVVLPANLLNVVYLNPVFFMLIFGCIWYLSLNVSAHQISVKGLTAGSIAIIGCSLFFALSKNYSSIHGYENRGMTGAWLSLAFTSSILVASKSKLIRILIIFFIASNLLLFSQKITFANVASDVRLSVLKELEFELSENAELGAIVVADLPCANDSDIYKNEIYCTDWDLKGALKSKGLDFSNVLVLRNLNFWNQYSNLILDRKLTIILVEFSDNFSLVKKTQTDSSNSVFNSQLADRWNFYKAKTLSDNDFCREMLKKAITKFSIPSTTKSRKCLLNPF